LTDNVDVAERIPVELCHAGFGRVLFSRVARNTWIARSAHTGRDATVAQRLLSVGRAHPRWLCAPLPEYAMVRRKAAILVENPQSDPRVNSDLVSIARPAVYIAAPVYVSQSVVALIHADAPSDGEDVGTADKDLLGIFAEGVGAILERNVTLDRMQQMARSAHSHSRDIDSLITLFDDHPWMNSAPENFDELLATAHRQHLTPVSDDPRFTQRESEVLRLLAVGRTNMQIAEQLFVSEGTVKSHVRRIMHKLDAANRTDAVAKYQRLIVGN
jgi:DNA-binding CsgD family transcriptional regulator